MFAGIGVLGLGDFAFRGCGVWGVQGFWGLGFRGFGIEVWG